MGVPEGIILIRIGADLAWDVECEGRHVGRLEFHDGVYFVHAKDNDGEQRLLVAVDREDAWWQVEHELAVAFLGAEA